MSDDDVLVDVDMIETSPNVFDVRVKGKLVGVVIGEECPKGGHLHWRHVKDGLKYEGLFRFNTPERAAASLVRRMMTP